MFRYFYNSVLVCMLTLLMSPVALSAVKPAEKPVVKENLAAALNHTMKTITGQKVNLAKKYKGRVLLLVNVASRCGLTPQYKLLQQLHKKYTKQGLSIVGVPCNQFNGQEPGTEKVIAAFCKKNYGVQFDLMSKVKVNGKEQCDLYKYLTSKKTNPKFPGPIRWNFEKILFNTKGEIVGRFAPRTKPSDKKIVAAITQELKKVKLPPAIKK